MSSLLPALLAGLAAGALLAPRTAGARLRALAPPPPRASRGSPSDALLQGVSAVAGGVLFLLVGGVPGALLAVGAAAAGPVLLRRLEAEEDDEPLAAAQLPLALDLLGACLAGGSPLPDAVAAVAAATPAPMGERLQRVHAALAVGAPPAEAFRVLGDGAGAAGHAARALVRSAEGGAPVAASVVRVAADARRTAASEATARARKAGVMATAPLGACFLPAFLLIGVVPTVLGLAGPLLGTLR